LNQVYLRDSLFNTGKKQRPLYLSALMISADYFWIC
jgi:hypothetical protein